MRMRLAVCLAVAVCLVGAVCCAGAAAPREDGDGVLQLDSDTFADAIERQTAPALLKFVTPDCADCKALEPEFRKVAASLKGIVPVASVDCTNPRATRTCRSFAAHQFPKVLVFKPGSGVNPYTGGALKHFDQYGGPGSAKALMTAVTDQLNASQITQLNTSDAASTLLASEPRLAKVLLFTDKPASTVLYKALAWAYVRRLVAAEVRPSDDAGKALAEHYGVTAYPTLLVVKPDGSKEVYDGPLKAPQLRTFLDGHATQEPLPDTGGEAAAASRINDPLAAFNEVVVHALTPVNLTDIDAQTDMWLIGFYAAGDGGCSEQLGALQKLLQEVQGIVQYGTLDVSGVDAAVLQQFEVDGTGLTSRPCSPQLVLLPFGEGKAAKGECAAWSGGLDDAKALQDWILKAVPDLTSPLSSELEAQAFLDASPADLPVPPKGSRAERDAPVGKVVLFTTKAEVPGIFKALAAHFAGKSRLVFAWSRNTVDGPGLKLMQKMNVRKAPAMAMLFPLPAKPLGEAQDVPNSPRDNMAMQQYMGPLKYQKMMGWLTAMSAVTGMAYKSHAGATTGPAPQDLEIRSQSQLQSACYDQPGLCLLTMVDGHSEQANKHRDTVKKASAALAGQPVNWVVVDVSRQPSFRRAYGFTADHLPALVAVSTRRMRFAQGAAPFSEESAKQLVTKVLTGTAVTLPLLALPQLVDGGEAAEVTPEAVEEEFRLDEIMAQEVQELTSKEARLQQAEEELRQEAKAQAGKAKKGNSGKKKKKGKKKAKGSGGSKKKAAKDEL